MKNGRLQAKDIPDERILWIIKVLNARGLTAFTSTFYELLPEFPPKVIRAKLRIMSERRKTLDGCGCGCTSYWHIL